MVIKCSFVSKCARHKLYIFGMMCQVKSWCDIFQDVFAFYFVIDICLYSFTFMFQTKCIKQSNKCMIFFCQMSSNATSPYLAPYDGNVLWTESSSFTLKHPNWLSSFPPLAKSFSFLHKSKSIAVVSWPSSLFNSVLWYWKLHTAQKEHYCILRTPSGKAFYSCSKSTWDQNQPYLVF